jgi:hypothetical protein
MGLSHGACYCRGMDHITLLFLILALIVVGVVVMLRRASKTDPLDQNPMRGTTRPSDRKI